MIMSAVTLAEYVTLYRSLGLNVIPLKPKSKEPRVPWKEYQTQKFEGEIAEGDNIAIICGKISNNLVVIDLDDPSLITELFHNKERLLKKTLVVQTARGTHIYCRPLTQMPRTTKLHDDKGRGIDIKGEGGYVVAAPSLHPSGAKYEIISNTNKIDVVDLDGLMDVLKTNGFKGSFDLDLGKLHHVMNDPIKQGERNDSLFIADKHMMNPNEKGLDPQEARKILGDINATRVSPPLTESEVDTIHASAKQNIPMVKPSEYDKRTFSREGVMNYLIRKFHCKTLDDTDEILIYKNGVYEGGAEPYLKAEIRSLYVGAPISEVKEVLDLVRSETLVKRGQFDTKRILNLKNCLIDLETMELFEHTPQFLSRKQLRANYNNYAQCPRFLNFIGEILETGEGMKTLMEMMSVTLTPYMKIEKAHVFVGEHDNGKSTVIKIIKKIFGPLMSAVSLQDIVNNQFAAAQLDGKMVNAFADLPRFTVKDMGKFKAIISHDDLMVHNKYGKMFSTHFPLTMIFSANNLPEIKDDNDATYKRFNPLQFGASIPIEKQDMDLLEKLYGEIDGILLLMIRNAHQLLKNKMKFTHPLSIKQVKEIWLEKADSVAHWQESKLKFSGDVWITRDRAYDDYKNYCVKIKQAPTTQRAFSVKMNSHPMMHRNQKQIGDKKQIVFYGASLKDDMIEGQKTL